MYSHRRTLDPSPWIKPYHSDGCKGIDGSRWCRCSLHWRESAGGPTLPTFAVQQVVGYLGYTGRAAD
jgi:hypothetical protein